MVKLAHTKRPARLIAATILATYADEYVPRATNGRGGLTLSHTGASLMYQTLQDRNAARVCLLARGIGGRLLTEYGLLGLPRAVG